MKTIAAALGVLCVVQQPAAVASSRIGAFGKEHTPKTAVVMELTIVAPGRETRKPRLTVDAGDTGIADFDGTGRLALRPGLTGQSRVVAITILDAAVTPMAELEKIRANVNGRSVPVKSRPGLSIAVLRTFDVK